MAGLVQARLDDETEAVLEQIVRRTGWSKSRVLREALHGWAKNQVARKPFRIIGQGEVSSGITDLGSNKKHLESLGMNSGVGKRARRNSL